MPKLTRRKLIAGAAAAPLALNGAAQAAPAKPGRARTSPASNADPVVAKVAEWMADRDALDAMLEEWSDLDAALIAKRKAMKLSAAQARRERLPETRAMRALDRKIKPGFKRLENE